MPAGANTIVQTVSFHLADHGTMYTLLNQLDPSQGPLNAIRRSSRTRSGSERPQRSGRHTTTTSTSRRGAAFSSPSRPGRYFAPEPTSSMSLVTAQSRPLI
jgi:hypothetical protein